MHKDVREIVDEAIRQGWRCVLRKSGHVLCFPPTAKPAVTLPGTPSGQSWRAKAIAQMRQSGFIWPRPRGR